MLPTSCLLDWRKYAFLIVEYSTILLIIMVPKRKSYCHIYIRYITLRIEAPFLEDLSI